MDKIARGRAPIRAASSRREAQRPKGRHDPMAKKFLSRDFRSRRREKGARLIGTAN
jgi:hypothetical protein